MKKIVSCFLLLFLIFTNFIQNHFVYAHNHQSQKAIVIGASSGIGKALVEVLAKNGYQVGLVARRVNLLQDIAQQLPSKGFIKNIDVADVEMAQSKFRELIKEMGSVDLVVINSGVGFVRQDLNWDKQKLMIDVNVRGFSAMANVALNYFVEQKHGHLVGISSIAAL